jgi:hypothetical protein
MSDLPAFRKFWYRKKEKPFKLESVRYWNKAMEVQHFLVRNRSEMTDAGMPMPLSVFFDADAQLWM